MSAEVVKYFDILINTHELSMAQVFKASINFAKSNGVEQPLLTLKNVSNKYRGKCTKNFLDCHNLLRSLMKLKEDHDLFYEFLMGVIEMEGGTIFLRSNILLQ